MAEQLPRIAILASGDRKSGGGGSTAERVVHDSLEGKVGFGIAGVICNNARGEVGVYDKIDALNVEFGLRGDKKIDVINIGPRTHPAGRLLRGQTQAESAAICRQLEAWDVGMVAALGYLRVATSEFVEEWGWKPEYGAADPLHNGLYHPKARVMNNHPGILPFTANTHGHETHEKAVELREAGIITHTAMTLHLINEGVDTGPVHYEQPILIRPEYDADMLGTVVQGVEKEITAPQLERYLIIRGDQLRAAA